VPDHPPQPPWPRDRLYVRWIRALLILQNCKACLTKRFVLFPKFLIKVIAMVSSLLLKHVPLYEHRDRGVGVQDAIAVVNLNDDVGPLAGKVVLGKVKFCFHKH
jgi:hypothetical protein